MKKLLGLTLLVALFAGLGVFAASCSSTPQDECSDDSDCADGLRCATDSEQGGAMTCRDFGF